MLENPARNACEAEQIGRAAEDNKVRLMVKHVCEFDGRYRYTADAIERGELGEIISIYLKRSTTGHMARLKGKVSMFHYMVCMISAMLLFARPALPKVYSQWWPRKCIFNAQDTAFNVITLITGLSAASSSLAPPIMMPVLSPVPMSARRVLGIDVKIKESSSLAKPVSGILI